MISVGLASRTFDTCTVTSDAVAGTVSFATTLLPSNFSSSFFTLWDPAALSAMIPTRVEPRFVT